jgi:hypothetical protein
MAEVLWFTVWHWFLIESSAPWGSPGLFWHQTTTGTGDKCKLNDASTGWQLDEDILIEDAKLG